MKTVAQLLDEKGRDVWTIGPDATVLDALQMLADKGVGALMVVDGDRVVGVISERDYARKVVLQGRTSRTALVSDIMTPRVSWVTPQHTVEQCMALMTDQRIRHLPVLIEERLEGLISIGDVVRAVISHQEFMIEQLERYITRG